MDNSTNGCYFISLIQALHNTAPLRDLFKDPGKFLFSKTSNALTSFNDQRDPNLTQHRHAVECLTDLFFRLDDRGPALEVAATENVLTMLRRLCGNEFGHQRNDAARVMDVIFGVLQRATERQEPYDLSILDKVYSDEQDKAIREGRPIQDLAVDAKERLAASEYLGFDSVIADLLLVQTASETVCTSEICRSPISRTWQTSLYLRLNMPKDRPPTEVIEIADLLDARASVQNDRAGPGIRCGYDPNHPERYQQFSRLIHLSPILIMQIDRSRGALVQRNTRTVVNEDLVLNQLRVPEFIDLAPWTNSDLPSQRGAVVEEDPTNVVQSTKYELTEVVRFVPGRVHYITFSKILDTKGAKRWICQDSLRQDPPVWDISPLNVQQVSFQDCFSCDEALGHKSKQHPHRTLPGILPYFCLIIV